MKIGKLEINGFAALAPMAGVADRAMREICRQYGCAFTVGELTSAKGVSLGDKKSAVLLGVSDLARPAASQLFGCEPDVIAAAVEKAMEYSPDFIDINMGCPAPKVAGNGGGSALMQDPELAGEIVAAAVKVSGVPVTVKMRTGWDSDSINAPELALICEQAGAATITVHGRTRKQMYAPPCDLDTVRTVKNTVKIPVIGNGDITDGKTAKHMYEYTGCDFVMVGRAACGNPFVFEEINAYMSGGEYTPPTLEERLSTCMRQIELMHIYKDPHNAILESRKHTAWYMKGMRGAAAIRRKCGEISSIDDIKRLFDEVLSLEIKGEL